MSQSPFELPVRPNVLAMKGYTPGEQPRVGKIVKLNTNENPYPPSPKVVQAIKLAAESGLQRYPDPRATPFRLQAAALWGVEPEWILAGNGSDDLLTILTRTFVGQDQTLRLPYPSYVLYHTLADIQAARSEEVPFTADWQLTDAFAETGDSLRLIYLPNPNSPSGTLVSQDKIRDLARRLHHIPLVIDEAYADFAESHCVDLVREFPNVIVTRTLSKSYGLAGLRFGYLIARPEVVEQLGKVKDSYNCDALSIAAATAALADQDWLRENVAQVRQSRDQLTTALQQLGFQVVPSQANFVWCTHPKQSHRALYEGLKAQGILVRYMDYAGWGDGLRISVGTAAQIDALLTVLRDLGCQDESRSA